MQNPRETGPGLMLRSAVLAPRQKLGRTYKMPQQGAGPQNLWAGFRRCEQAVM